MLIMNDIQISLFWFAVGDDKSRGAPGGGKMWSFNYVLLVIKDR